MRCCQAGAGVGGGEVATEVWLDRLRREEGRHLGEGCRERQWGQAGVCVCVCVHMHVCDVGQACLFYHHGHQEASRIHDEALWV